MELNGLTNESAYKLQEEVLRPSRQAPQLPDWLQRASEEDRQYYFDTEQSVTESEQALDELLGEVKSLKAFARFQAREVVRILCGEVVDPDHIFVSTHYTFFVGKQKVVQSNRLTLPEFMLNDLHGSTTLPLEIKLEGQALPSGVTAEDLLEVMVDASMRKFYAEQFEKKYTDEAVIQAQQILLSRRIRLSSFSAKLQRHISDESLQIVAISSQGDERCSMGALSFGDAKGAFEGMIVCCGPQGEEGPCVLYAPQAPGGRSWYEFASFRQLNFHLFDWTAQPEGRSYLSRQALASERASFDAYMRRLQDLPSQWCGIQRSPWPNSAEGALRQGVMLHVDWLRGEMQAVVPAGYRSATATQRQCFARLNTELKGLTRLASREAALISYEDFATKLIKKRAEEVLAQHGETVDIDPDLIVVRLDDSSEMTLSRMIIDEHHITEESGPAHNPGIYPSIRLSPGHPPVSSLLIKYLPGWSRTLRPGEQYIAMLRADYLDQNAPGYALKRDVYADLRRNEMHRSALEALFNGHLERKQFEQIEGLIDQSHEVEPDPISHVEDPESPQREGLYRFYLQGCQVEGLYIFRLMHNGVADDLLYTPSAPDCRSFRPLAEFARSVKTAGLGSYYSKRAKLTQQKVVSAYLEKVKLRSIEDIPHLQLDSRVRDFSRCYTDAMAQIIDDVDAKTTSLAEIVGKLIYDTAVAAVTIVSIPFAPIGLALSAVVMTKAVFEGAKAFQEGSYEKLFSTYLDCMMELATMRIGKLGFSMVQKAIAKQLGNVNTCMGVISACTGKTVDLAVVSQLMKESLAEPDSSEQTILM
ncbi:dermonecrotic toxin domain-containing protein [Pseudomonas sp. NPDC087336]|uniref:dermonecrotic toxin domain-containing protein n=1 Tax=Pseudomonas sp. NPDC087336 TaxID=3364436 RepID=UPI0037F98663